MQAKMKMKMKRLNQGVSSIAEEKLSAQPLTPRPALSQRSALDMTYAQAGARA